MAQLDDIAAGGHALLGRFVTTTVPLTVPDADIVLVPGVGP